MAKTPKIPGRFLTVKLKTARGRKNSSQRWLQRQLNDPYVTAAKQAGYRSRAVFKLQEIQDKYQLLQPNYVVIDLGAAPGGWAQLTSEYIGTEGLVIALDLLQIDPLAGVNFIQGDFTDPAIQAALKAQLRGCKANVLLSDMAPASTGHPPTDHLRIMGLVDEVVLFAQEHLAPHGHLLLKIFQGGEEKALLQNLRRLFQKVKIIKPPASRKDSAEVYVLALHYK